MRDEELTQRPGNGWTPWRKGAGKGSIERVWWQAKELHFPKLNVTVWFDGSDLVGIEHWGYRPEQWTMKQAPADWTPMPFGYRETAEATWQEHCARGANHRRRPVEADTCPLVKATG